MFLSLVILSFIFVATKGHCPAGPCGSEAARLLLEDSPRFMLRPEFPEDTENAIKIAMEQHQRHEKYALESNWGSYETEREKHYRLSAHRVKNIFVQPAYKSGHAWWASLLCALPWPPYEWYPQDLRPDPVDPDLTNLTAWMDRRWCDRYPESPGGSPTFLDRLADGPRQCEPDGPASPGCSPAWRIHRQYHNNSLFLHPQGSSMDGSTAPAFMDRNPTMGATGAFNSSVRAMSARQMRARLGVRDENVRVHTRAVLQIRDPRDTVVSAWHYERKCAEPPHRNPEQWKREKHQLAFRLRALARSPAVNCKRCRNLAKRVASNEFESWCDAVIKLHRDDGLLVSMLMAGFQNYVHMIATFLRRDPATGRLAWLPDGYEFLDDQSPSTHLGYCPNIVKPFFSFDVLLEAWEKTQERRLANKGFKLPARSRRHGDDNDDKKNKKKKKKENAGADDGEDGEDDDESCSMDESPEDLEEKRLRRGEPKHPGAEATAEQLAEYQELAANFTVTLEKRRRTLAERKLNQKLQKKANEAMEQELDGLEYWNRWTMHRQDLADARAPVFRVLRYEDLYTYPYETFLAIGRWLFPEAPTRASEFARVFNEQNQALWREKQTKRSKEGGDVRNKQSKGEVHFRSGKTEQWRKELLQVHLRCIDYMTLLIGPRRRDGEYLEDEFLEHDVTTMREVMALLEYPPSFPDETDFSFNKEEAYQLPFVYPDSVLGGRGRYG